MDAGDQSKFIMNIQYEREYNDISELQNTEELYSFINHVAEICVNLIFRLLSQLIHFEIQRQVIFVTLGLSGVCVYEPNFIGNRIFTQMQSKL